MSISVITDPVYRAVLGDTITFNIFWYDNGVNPATQPYQYNLKSADNSNVNYPYDVFFPATFGDGVATTHSITPSTVGYTEGNGRKFTSFKILPYDANGNNTLNYGKSIRWYYMPNLTVSVSPSTVTSFGETVTISWMTTGDCSTVNWDQGDGQTPNTRLWSLYGGIPGQTQTGSFTLTQGQYLLTESSGTKVFNFNCRHDEQPSSWGNFVSPPELAARLNDTASVSIDIVIPVYGISSNKTLYNEGETMYCAVTTSNVAAGTTVYWAIEPVTGSIGLAADPNPDFNGPTNGGFQLDSNGSYTWSVGIKDDALVEYSENFKLKLYSDASNNNEIAESGFITIQTSDQPVYAIAAAKSIYNEGETVYCAVSTSNVATGTILYWKILGGGVNTNDFTDTLEGSGTLNNNGQFTFNRTLSNDSFTEGQELFKLQLFTSGVGTNLVAESPLYTIQDTSTTTTYVVTPSTISVNEGSTLTYGIGTSGVPLGTTLYWSIEGVGITSGDFSGYLTGSGVVSNTVSDGGFSVTKTVTADQVTEGLEVISFRLCTDAALTNEVASNTQVGIQDTSPDPPPAAPTITFTASSTNINSGQAVVLVWNVTNSDDTIINQGIGSVPNSSTETVYPTSTITYTLSATGPGGTNSATVTIAVALPVTLNVSGPSQIDWQQSPIPINITASNSPGIILYETYDGVVKPSVSIPNSTGTVSFIPYNYIPDWSSPVDIIQLHFAAGTTANHTLVMSVGVDRTPDPIIIPTTISSPNEEVISPLIAVEVQDIDVPIEIKADQPIQVQVGGNTNWEDVREG